MGGLHQANGNSSRLLANIFVDNLCVIVNFLCVVCLKFTDLFWVLWEEIKTLKKNRRGKSQFATNPESGRRSRTSFGSVFNLKICSELFQPRCCDFNFCEVWGGWCCHCFIFCLRSCKTNSSLHPHLSFSEVLFLNSV